MELNKIYTGDCMEVMKTFPDACIDACITSIPYWGLRDYGVQPTVWPVCSYSVFGMNVTVNEWTGCYGLEPTPEMFTAHTVLIFEEVKRVLKKTGTLWLNIGDSYASGKRNRDAEKCIAKSGITGKEHIIQSARQINKKVSFLKNKDMAGIPWMVAFALRDNGWYLRQDNIWHKKNTTPESVTDRCTKAHEYFFLFSKSKKYFFDSESVKTPTKGPEHDKWVRVGNKRFPDEKVNGIRNPGYYPTANLRSVWGIATEPLKESHFAAFPQRLAEIPVLAGTSEYGVCSVCGKPYKRVIEKTLVPAAKASFNTLPDKRDYEADKNSQMNNRSKDGHKPGWAYISQTKGWQATCPHKNAGVIPATVMDPFSGSGTTFIVARKKGRNAVSIDIKPDYVQMSEKRAHQELGMFK